MPKRPNEIGSIEDNRNWLIALRNAALVENNFEIAVGLSHTIAWLYYLIELEGKKK